MGLLAQCRHVCQDHPDVDRFIVPTMKVTRSHGAHRMITETKVKYPGYVFGKLRLCEDVYERIQTLPALRSWMGSVRYKGTKKLPPAPVPLSLDEVEQFGLEEWEEEEEKEDPMAALEATGIIVDESDDHDHPKVDEEAVKEFLGLKVNDVIKVTAAKNRFHNEEGFVRRLKEGKIFVRFFTYGTMFEEWLLPSDVRKLTEVEQLRGVSGPDRPVSNDDLKPFRPKDPRSRRHDVDRGAGNRRSRRQDRNFESNNDAYENAKNWKWYQEDRKGAAGDIFEDGGRIAMSAGSRQVQSPNNYSNQRFTSPKKKQRKPRDTFDEDWSSFVSTSGKTETGKTDDFFDSLMSDLSSDLDSPGQKSADSGFYDMLNGDVTNDKPRNSKSSRQMSSDSDFDSFLDDVASEIRGDNKGASEADDFFDKLTQEVDSEVSSSRGGNNADDFFATLQADRGSLLPSRALEDQSSDDFFDSLGADLEADLSADIESLFGPPDASEGSKANMEKSSALHDQSNENFFGALGAELEADFESNSNSVDSPPKSNDDFFDSFGAELEADLGGDLDAAFVSSPDTNESNTKAQSTSRVSNVPPSTPENLKGLKVAELKDMLKQKGLKVSGKKSELIERLSS